MTGRKPNEAERKQVKRALNTTELWAGGCLLLQGQGWNRACPIDIRDLVPTGATPTTGSTAKKTTKKTAAKKTTTTSRKK